MGNTVLFSFMGTGDYTAVRYSLRGTPTSERETFVQCALIRCLQAENRQVDRAVIAMTKRARAKHGSALQKELESLVSSVHILDIPDGSSEDELWEIFNTIGHGFYRGEHVVFDLTHGLRSLSAAALLAMGFFRHVLQLDVQVYYGAFELVGKSDFAPIFDLTPMFVLPAWAEAIAEWRRTGRATGLVAQTRPHTDALKRALKADAPRALTRLPKDLEMLADALTILRHDKVGTQAANVAKNVEEAKASIQEQPRLTPLGNVLDQLHESVERLCGPGETWQDYSDAYLRHQLQIVEWLKDHSRIVEAFSFLREFVSSCAARIVKSAGIHDIDGKEPSDTSFRVCSDGICAHLTGAKTGSIKEEQIASVVKPWLEPRPALRRAFSDVWRITQTNRNQLNHCWAGEHGREKFTEASAKNIVKNLEKATTAAHELLQELSKEASIGDSFPHKTPEISQEESSDPPAYFLNLSNHPLDTWSEPQMQGARDLGLGKPQELQGGMPLVPPDADQGEVMQLAEQIADRAVKQGAQGAFVAGEFSLTHALVNKLSEREIRCFTATTKRQASEVVGPDGTVTRSSVFSFVRWREYAKK